ncbi:MAG TPA: GlxA family transcriptional regulator [Ensifer sp.]|jgi:transcriptional regulator GlxA family with amidase domain|uniref:GlxA family transcriptional regulator n=1 Tax=Ensifer sp. TaxID=1872086 RepID=UPI002E0E4775|nr:GlxA family transcriptional regulator [Ensifer sp.]
MHRLDAASADVKVSRRDAVVSPADGPKLRVGFVLAKKFTLSAFALFADTLRLAGDEGDRSRRMHCDWDILSNCRNSIRSSCGIQVVPTALFTDPTKYDYIAVVGGLLDVEQPLAPEALVYLHKASRAGVGLIGLCTGSFILADEGHLKGHLACVSWLHHREFRDRFPRQTVALNQIFRLDRKRATCAGGSAVADLAAAIVHRHIGEAAERNALEILQINARRNAEAAQARIPLTFETKERRVRNALLLMEQHIEDWLPITAIASLIGVSRRQLERLFHAEVDMSPNVAYVKIRMDAAMKMIVNTSSPIIQVALACGFESDSHFTRRFRCHFGKTPSAIRQGIGR